MSLNTEPVRSWFGHTRRERRASFILLCIIVIIISVRFVLPWENIKIEDVSSLYTDSVSADTAIELQEVQLKAVPVKSKAEQRQVKKKLLDLNSCDSTGLMQLPGIGPVLSARMIKYRKKLGGFAGVEQLKEVYGLPAETFDRIKLLVSADTSLIRRVRINEANYRELARIPYIEKYEVSAILKFRQINGRIGGPGDLVRNKIISAEKAERIIYYLDFK